MRAVDFLKDKRDELGRLPRVGFLGLGVTNSALLSAVRPYAGEITLRSEGKIHGALPDCDRFRSGNDALSDIDEDVLFLSPSVRRDRRELMLASERGVMLTSDADLFFEDARNVFCVTGSDGKSTTTAMAADMLGVPAIGNIGIPYVDFDSRDSAVAELSSFNLEYLTPYSPRCVITNITPNHLDWHKDFGEYIEAKKNILTNSGGAVLSADDVECRKIARGGCFCLFSVEHTLRELTFEFNAEHYITLSYGAICLDGEPILRVEELANRERYSILNLMAAIGLTYGFAERDSVVRVASEFKSLPHRGTTVCYGGIEFIDSSIDTTPSRCAATLTGLGRRVHLILGGRGKRLPPDPLFEPIRKYAVSVGAYGDMRGEIAELMCGSSELSEIPFYSAERLYDLLDTVCSSVKAGDTVLLSPAGTGYGEFRNYAERGEAFLNYARIKYECTDD